MKDVSVSNSKSSDTTIASSVLELARCGDNAAFERITQLYIGLVFYWCRSKGLTKEDAEDLVQQVFVKVFRSLGDFKREKPCDSFRGWLRVITRNQVIDHLRRNDHREKAYGGELNLEVAEEVSATDSDLIERNAENSILYRDAVRLMQSEFSSQDCEAFTLVEVDNMTPREAAEKLGISVNSVYIAKSRIKKRLREVFPDLLDE